MDSPISLQYPNGRVHEQTLTTTGALTPGGEFDLYGRHWNAVGLVRLSRWEPGQQRRLCVSTAGLLTPDG